MTKKETFIPIAIFALTALFVLVSVMVYLSKGQSAKWVNRKMKIGALLLSLNYISCGSYKPDNQNTTRYFSSCYDIAFNTNNLEISIEQDTNRLIYGYIRGTVDDDFSYSLLDDKGKLIKKEDVFLKRYHSDPGNEEFLIELDKHLDTGNYRLKLFNSKINGQDTAILLKEFDIRIQ